MNIFGLTIRPISITVAAVASEARRMAEMGHCPVECSFGGDSVIDSLSMDHHGPESWREPVSVRAFRDHWGARSEDPRFVVTGSPDADATFAIACLAGQLPRTRGGSLDPGRLAQRIAEFDNDPFRRPASEDPEGLAVLLFNRLAGPLHDATAFHGGVERWRWILALRNPNPWFELVRSLEIERRNLAASAEIVLVGPDVAAVRSAAWGWDVWYAEVRPMVVAFVETTGRITLGCRDIQTARRLLGETGLLAAYPLLQPSGWGGRETVGGSPRDSRLTWSDAIAVARRLQSLVSAVPGSTPVKPRDIP